VLDDYGMSFVVNTGIYCLNTLIIDEIGDTKCGIRRPVRRISACHRRTGIRHVKDDMPKTLVKFMLVGLRHDGHV